jgi:molybdopterin-guanine dinucleotide biosynthesis protein A
MAMTADGAAPIVGTLLAGGRAVRLGGGDKCLREIGGRPLLAHVIARAAPQVGRLVLNANGDAGRFRSFGLPVVADAVEGFAGPLAGIVSGLLWARDQAAGCRWVATFATDTPFFPCDLVTRLQQGLERESAEIAYAASGGRTHPVFGLWPVGLADALLRAMREEGMRKIDAWAARYAVATVDFPVEDGDPFFNINEPADLVLAGQRLAADRAGSAT